MSEAEELIERIARAIWESCNGPYEFAGEEGRAIIQHEARAALAALRPGDRLPGGLIVAPTRLIEEAHAVMCETGWCNAIHHQRSDDGVIEAAASQIEDEFRTLIVAIQQEGGSDNG